MPTLTFISQLASSIFFCKFYYIIPRQISNPQPPPCETSKSHRLKDFVKSNETKYSRTELHR